MEYNRNKLNEKELTELLEKIKNCPTIERSLAEIQGEVIPHIPSSVIEMWPIAAQENLFNFRKAIANCRCKKCIENRL